MALNPQDREYMDFMTQMSPMELPIDRQRAVAQNLRGLGGVGALGSTSQIAEISNAGTGAMDQSFSMGKQMGEMENEEQDRRSREIVAKERLNKSNNLTRFERKTLLDMSKESQVVGGMLDSFDDDFGNLAGAGFVERLVQKGMTSESPITEWLSTKYEDTIGGKNEQELIDMKARLAEEQKWWGAYERMSKIPERAEAFGATLTPNELTSWNSADINPGMTADQIRSNLATRKSLADGWFNQVADYYGSLGFPQESIDALLAGRVDVAGAMNLTGANGAPSSNFPQTTGAIGSSVMPEGFEAVGTAEEWSSMSTSEQEEALELMEYL